VIKPNLAELADLLGAIPRSQREVQQAARKIHAEYGSNVIVTLGVEGAVVLFGNRSYFVHPVSVPTRSAAGAGDGILAGMALAYLRRESLEYGLQHGFALAGAIVQTLATADFHVEDYQKLLPQIRITPLE
jgi:fructose-1-phosphate kinase PfkB-like protein